MIKQIIKKIILMPVSLFTFLYLMYEKTISKIFPQLDGYSRQIIIDMIDKDKKEVKHNNSKFWLFTPNKICSFRHLSFSRKEPEIIEWIQDFGGSGAFYDVGANIGLYSIYYAKSKSGNVFSFEPSFFNLRQLAKNININQISDRVNIVSTPLTDTTGISTLTNGSFDEGGALSSFGVDYGHDGKTINSEIKTNVIGFSLDDLVEKKIIQELPSLMKIDVDGIEHLILKGATKTLRSENLKSVFIEVNEDFDEQALQVKNILESTGFELKGKYKSDYMRNNIQFFSTFNQIWIKN